MKKWTAYALLANMKIAFLYVDKEMKKKIITSFIKSTLEYAAAVWSPQLKKHTGGPRDSTIHNLNYESPI